MEQLYHEPDGIFGYFQKHQDLTKTELTCFWKMTFHISIFFYEFGIWNLFIPFGTKIGSRKNVCTSVLLLSGPLVWLLM